MLRSHLASFTLALTLTACGTPMPGPDSGTGGGGGVNDGGFFADFTAPATTAVNNSLFITVTGESSATEGNAFPPAAGAELYFLDGWEITYEHVLVTVGSVNLSEGPDTNPNDQAVTGPLVAEVNGPWAVDLAKAGPLDSKEQNGKSVPPHPHHQPEQEGGNSGLRRHVEVRLRLLAHRRRRGRAERQPRRRRAGRLPADGSERVDGVVQGHRHLEGRPEHARVPLDQRGL